MLVLGHIFNVGLPRVHLVSTQSRIYPEKQVEKIPGGQTVQQNFQRQKTSASPLPPTFHGEYKKGSPLQRLLVKGQKAL